MPTAFTHGFVALALGKTAVTKKMPPRFWVLSVLCAVLPDADVIGFRYGIRYGDLLGHRGFSHSLLFALLLGMFVVFLAFRDVPKFSKKWWALAAYFFVVTASHGLLDAMTTGGLGIGFFIPFDDTRYFLPWRPVAVSAIRLSKFLSASSMHVLWSEFICVWIPAMLLMGGVWAWRSGSFLRRRTMPLP
jgi:inner membrane protein